MSDNHAVVAAIDGEHRMVRICPSYNEAAALWAKLMVAFDRGRLVEVDTHSTQTRANIGLAQRVIHGSRSTKVGPVNYLAVRSMDDPVWKSAKPIRLAVLALGKGSRDPDASIRLLGADVGVHGHEGGWTAAVAVNDRLRKPGGTGRKENP